MVIVLCIILQTSLKSRQSLQDVHVLLISLQHLKMYVSSKRFSSFSLPMEAGFANASDFRVRQQCQDTFTDRNYTNCVELIDDKKGHSRWSRTVLELFRFGESEYFRLCNACMVFTWACIISYYNLISRCVFPSENINSQCYKHMFQIICVLTRHNSITCKNVPTFPCSHTQKHAQHSSLTFISLLCF